MAYLSWFIMLTSLFLPKACLKSITVYLAF